MQKKEETLQQEVEEQRKRKLGNKYKGPAYVLKKPPTLKQTVSTNNG